MGDLAERGLVVAARREGGDQLRQPANVADLPRDGAAVEVGVIGREGMAGVSVVLGVDVSHEFIALARKRALETGVRNVRFEVMDACALDLRDSYWDVVISHLHPDHCADFSALTVYRRYHPHPPPAGMLPVYGPPDAAERLIAAYAPNAEERNRTNLSDLYTFRPYGGVTAKVGALGILAAPVEHSCEAYAVRISHAGRALVYSGDTGPCPQLVKLATGADLLLAEASWPDRPDNPPAEQDRCPRAPGAREARCS